MATKAKVDSYSNIAAILVTSTADAAFTAAKFAFPFSIMDKMALVIQRVEYTFGSLNQLNGTTDRVILGLYASATVSDADAQNDPLVIDSCRVVRMDLGVAASGTYMSFPFIKDFTTLAGGGLLVAPSPLYAGILSSGAAGVMNAWVRLYYTYMEMATDEYWQLVESRRIISS